MILQIATAVYFVLIDCILVSQYFYALVKNQGLKGTIVHLLF